MSMPADPSVLNQAPPASQTAPPQQYAPPASVGGQFFTHEDIEKARREERDKLYGRISKTDEKFKTLEDEVAALRQTAQQRSDAEAAARQAADDALRAQQQEELSAKELISQREAEWKQRFEEMERKRENDRLIYEKDKAYQEMRNYIIRRSGEETAQGLVGPELIDFIVGETPEQVEASIVILRDKTKRILEGIREGQQQNRAGMPGVSTSGQPPAGGPLDNLTGQQTQQLSAADIARIPMSQWHEARQQLGLGSGDSNQGLYG